jgi:hypothetical protein
MFVPLAHLRRFDFGEIVLNNNGVDPIAIAPVWFIEGKAPVEGRTLTLPPETMQYVNLNDLLRFPVPTERIGGLAIEFEGKLMELGGQVVLRHGIPPRRADPRLPTSSPGLAEFDSAGKSNNLDVPFSMTMDFKSTRQEATWTGSRDDEVELALANTAPQPIEVKIATPSGAESIRMGAFQSRLLRLPAVKANGTTAMWAVIDSNGAPGDLRITGFSSRRGEAARLIRFYDPDAIRQPHLFATGLRTRNARADLAIKNTTPDTLNARPQFLDGSSGHVLAELPPVTLRAGAAATLNLQSVLTALAQQTEDASVSVRVESDGPAGGLIGSLYARDLKRGTLFDVPLRDSGAARKSTGSYPWRIDDDYQTVVSITNAGPIPAKFVARIAYADGELVLKPRELAPGASASFDLRAFRDTRQTDSKGRALPRDVTQGRFLWSIHSSGAIARLIGRAEMVSDSLGVSSSYSCGVCCPDSFVWGSVNPYQLNLAVASTGDYTVVGEYENCYGSQYEVGVWSSWQVDSSIASVYTPDYGAGRATGESEGTTNVTAYWPVEYWEPNIEDCDLTQTTDEEPAIANVVCAVPTNFRETLRIVQPGAGLAFSYAWSSSTGYMSDLEYCAIGEVLDYSPNPWPSPPFKSNLPGFPNGQPHYFTNGGRGEFTDAHGYGGAFVQPFTAASVNATQSYYYACNCANNGNRVTMMGPHNISRVVTQNPNGTWKYTITKLGLSMPIDPMQ